MINQRAYPDIPLGYGKLPGQSIGMVGCYAMDLLQGLLERGWQFSVIEWNEYLKSHGIYTPQNPTSISAAAFPSKCPDIFLEGRNEAWNDSKLINYMNNWPEYIVIGEVDARGIGGSGQHFVYIEKIDVVDGKIKMTYIGDPWDGLPNQKVTTRYNKYNNILSLRVFKIKKGAMPDEMITVKKSDWERVRGASERGDRTIGWLGGSGNIADKTDQQVQELITQFGNKKFDEGKASVPSTPPTGIEPPAEIELKDKSKWHRNGLQYVEGKLTGNYEQV